MNVEPRRHEEHKAENKPGELYALAVHLPAEIRLIIRSIALALLVWHSQISITCHPSFFSAA